MRFFILSLAVIFALAGSGWSQESIRANPSAVLRNNDSFELQIGGVPLEYALEFRLPYTVGDDGNVQVPLIGSVRASGLTISQFAAAVTKKLQDDKIFTFPTVTVNLVPQSRFVTVGGAVRAPQAVPWSQDLTLSSAIMRAGGATEFGNMKRVRISRGGEVRFFNLKIADKDPNQNPKLLPSDEVTVAE